MMASVMCRLGLHAYCWFNGAMYRVCVRCGWEDR